MKRTLRIATAATLAALGVWLAAPAVANAGHHHHHHHHGHHHHGGSFGLGFGLPLLGSPPMPFTPPPAYAPPADLAPALPPPNFLPTPSAPTAPGVVLLNPLENAVPVAYTLNGTPYAIKPGFEQKLPAGQPWTLEFDRGGAFGLARYTLAAGIYQFRVTEKGWDVVLKTDPAAPAAPSLAAVPQ